MTITHDDADAIYYTTDGNDPTTSSTLYSGSFTINATTTVKAIAVKNDVSSSVASATFTKVTGVADIAEALTQTGQFIFAGSATVVYQSEDNKYLYIKDDSDWGLVYGTVDGTYSNGDILDPDWKASNIVYNGLPEFNNPVASTFNSTNSGTAVEPVALSTINGDTPLNMYATMNNLTVSSVSNDGKTISLSGVNFVLRKQFDVTGLPTFTVDKTYNVRGFVGIYQTSNNTTYQFYPIWAEEVVSSDPTVTFTPTSLTIDDSGTANTVDVEARNIISGFNLGVSHQNNDFSIVLSSETNIIPSTWVGFEQNNGSVDGTIAVTYTGRDLIASDVITAATEGASKTITVKYEPNLYIYCDNAVSPWNFQANPAIAMTNNGDSTYTATLSDIPANSHILFGRASGLTYTWDNDNNRLFFGAVMDNGADWQYGYNEQPGAIDTNPTNPVKYRPIWFPEAGTYTVTINANNRTFTITKEVVLTGDFTLVKDIANLKAGDEIIFVSSGSAGSADAMSTTQASSNRPGTAVTVSNALQVTATDATQIFKLEAATDDWYFHTVNGDNQGYIYAASSSGNQLKTEATADDNAKATISLASDGAATIIFQGSNTRNHMRYNPNNGSPIFACYASNSTVQNLPYIYKRSAAPSISVQSTLDLVIPAGETSASETVTVTETNVTGTTSISSVDGNASNFNVTLSGTTLSVTYNGTATEDSPEVITINLVNGEATASIIVTGYKVPLTVTISPANGATFSENSMNGTITANNEDAVIYYKTNEMSDFEVYNGSFTVTNSATENPSVQAYAVCGGETSATATATYHHVSLSETLFTRVTSTNQLVAGNKYIIVYEDGDPKPLALHGEGLAESVAWSGDNINIAGTSTTVFTLGGTAGDYTLYNVNYGYLTHDNKSTRYTQTANSLTIYGSETYGYFVQEGSYDLRFNTGVNINDDPFRWYNNEAGTEAVLYVQGVEETPSLTLADLVTTGEKDHDYTISDQLQAAKVTWDENYGKFAIFAKDDEMYANKRYPTDGMDEYLIAFENQNGTVVNTVAQKDYDQSNWIEILIPSSVTGKPHADYQSTLDELKLRFENKILAAGTVSGTYKDDLNPTILMTGEPVVETSSGTTSTYVPNYYCTANFLQENLDADGAQSHRTDELAGGSYFMMDAKPQEFCKVVWAYYTGSGDVFVAPEREGDLVNGLRFHGSFKANMSLCEDKGVTAERTVSDCFAASSATNPAVLYGFNAIVRKNPAYNATPASGAPSRINPYTEGIESTPAYIVYPLNAGTTSDGNVTEVNEVVSGKTVESVRFYNLMGVESDKPFEGVNIVETRYTDGSRSTVKVLR
ncbi:MAG: chitobiase/beta-hexosaminidase C-terminal domain-containing protein [Muribaculaceae bacterium]|nr:chitobiase/beta-hexosaminidase C-terminal domain-containing protein [Muribaculaceae bacterium]